MSSRRVTGLMMTGMIILFALGLMILRSSATFPFDAALITFLAAAAVLGALLSRRFPLRRSTRP
jgi:hypothetical protein